MEITHIAQDPKDDTFIIVTWSMTKKEYAELLDSAQEEVNARAKDDTDN